MFAITDINCGDGYTDAATLGPVFGSNGGYFLVSGNDAWVQLGYGRQGQWQWMAEAHVAVGNGILTKGTVAIRFRNYVAGSVAAVTAALASAAEPAPFGSLGTMGVGGAATTAQWRLPLKLTNPYVTADTGNAYGWIQSVTGADVGAWAFSPTAEGAVFGSVLVPPGYASGGAIVLAFSAESGTGNAIVAVASRAVASGVAFNPVSFTLEANVTVVVGAANTLYLTTVTLTPALTANNWLLVQILRRGSLAGDTLTGLLLLLGAWLDVTVTS